MLIAIVNLVVYINLVLILMFLPTQKENRFTINQPTTLSGHHHIPSIFQIPPFLFTNTPASHRVARLEMCVSHPSRCTSRCPNHSNVVPYTTTWAANDYGRAIAALRCCGSFKYPSLSFHSYRMLLVIVSLLAPMLCVDALVIRNNISDLDAHYFVWMVFLLLRMLLMTSTSFGSLRRCVWKALVK